MERDEMARNGNHLPRPEAIWIALGIVVFAIVRTMSRKKRALFIAELKSLVAEHEGADRVIAFGSRARWNGGMLNAIRGGVFWIRRLIVELERAAGE